MFFALLLKHAFKSSTDCVYLYSRSDGRLFNISRFSAKTKTRTVTIRDLLFADDAAMASHQQDGLQSLMDRFSDACNLFGLTISQRKTQVMGQATLCPSCITVNGEELEVVHQFQYLGSTTTDTLSLDVELSKGIGKTSTTLSKLIKRVWENKHLTIPTKIKRLRHQHPTLANPGLHTPHKNGSSRCFICGAFVGFLELHGRTRYETTMSSQEQVSHLCSHFHVDAVYAGWAIDHRVDDVRIFKDLLYGELATGARRKGRPSYALSMYASVT